MFRARAILVVLSCCVSVIADATAREWTDRTGKYSLEAEFVQLKDGKVHLKRADSGAVIGVPAGKLSKNDREFLAKLLVKDETGTGAHSLFEWVVDTEAMMAARVQRGMNKFEAAMEVAGNAGAVFRFSENTIRVSNGLGGDCTATVRKTKFDSENELLDALARFHGDSFNRDAVKHVREKLKSGELRIIIADIVENRNNGTGMDLFKVGQKCVIYAHGPKTNDLDEMAFTYLEYGDALVALPLIKAESERGQKLIEKFSKGKDEKGQKSAPTEKKTATPAEQVAQGKPGELKWRLKLPNPVRCCPAMGLDGNLYVVQGAGVTAVSQQGEVKWTCKLSSRCLAVSVAADGTIYAGTDQGLSAIGADGKHRGDKELGSVSVHPAFGSDGTVYVGSWEEGILYALTRTGAEKWSFKAGGQMNSSPAIGNDGTIYAASYNKKLHAISPTGKKRWTFEVTESGISSSPALAEDGTIYIGDDILRAISPEGTLKWEFDVGDNNSVGFSPVIGLDNTVYVAVRPAGVYAVSAQGKEKWHYDWAGDLFNTPAGLALGRDGTLYAAVREVNLKIVGMSFGKTGRGLLYALDSAGKKRWAFEFPAHLDDYDGDATPIIGSDGTVYIGGQDGTLYALHSDSGGPARSSWPLFRCDLQNTGNAGRETKRE